MLQNETVKIVENPIKAPVDESILEGIGFRWKQQITQFSSKLLRRLDEFRRKNMYCDIIITTNNDSKLSAHKMVLAACGGMFRPKDDDKFKKSTSVSLTEISLDCPVVGIRTIIKFAYSGILEINHQNLFPTFLAAIETEMNEIQDICSGIILSKFSWLLTFDGSENSLSRNYDSKMPSSLESAFHILYQLLQMDLVNLTFTEKSGLNSNDKELSCHCLEALGYRWPHLKEVYSALMKCIHKAEKLEKAKMEKPEDTSKFSERKLPPEINDTEICKIQVQDEEGRIIKIKPSNSSRSQADAPLANDDRICETERNSQAKVASTVSINQVSLNDGTHQDKRQQKTHVQSTLPMPSAHSPSHESITSSPRKHASSNPPAVPPNPFRKNDIRTKSGASSNFPHNKPLHLDRTKAPKGVSKVPPPRPKPPVIQKKTMKSNEISSQEYDDTLNPFAV